MTLSINIQFLDIVWDTVLLLTLSIIHLPSLNIVLVNAKLQRLTAEMFGPPGDIDAMHVALMRVGGQGSAEALAVPSGVAPAAVELASAGRGSSLRLVHVRVD